MHMSAGVLNSRGACIEQSPQTPSIMSPTSLPERVWKTWIHYNTLGSRWTYWAYCPHIYWWHAVFFSLLFARQYTLNSGGCSGWNVSFVFIQHFRYCVKASITILFCRTGRIYIQGASCLKGVLKIAHLLILEKWFWCSSLCLRSLEAWATCWNECLIPHDLSFSYYEWWRTVSFRSCHFC